MISKMAFEGFNRPTPLECRRACDLLAGLHGLPVKATAGEHGICDLPGPHTVLDSLVRCCCCCCCCWCILQQHLICVAKQHIMIMSYHAIFASPLTADSDVARYAPFLAKTPLTSHHNAPSLVSKLLSLIGSTSGQPLRVSSKGNCICVF